MARALGCTTLALVHVAGAHTTSPAADDIHAGHFMGSGLFRSDADPSKCIDFSLDAPHLADCDKVQPVTWDSSSLEVSGRCLTVVDGSSATPKLGMQECDGLNAAQAWGVPLDGPIVACPDRAGFPDDCELFCIDALGVDGSLTDISFKKCDGADGYRATQMWKWQEVQLERREPRAIRRSGFFKSDANPSKCIDFSSDAPHLDDCDTVVSVTWDSVFLEVSGRCLAVVDGGSEKPKLGMQECDGLDDQSWSLPLDGPMVAFVARPGFPDERDVFCIDALGFDGELTDISFKKCAGGGDGYPATQMWKWMDDASLEFTSSDTQTFV
jgi:hypothetical protein